MGPELRRCTAHLADAAATRALGAAIGRLGGPGTTVLLAGAIGAGKTTLAQGVLAVWAGVASAKSPTFTLVASYPGDVHHVDLYRLTEDEAEDVDVMDLFGPSSRVIVEWWERAPRLMPPEALSVRLQGDGAGRLAVLEASGAACEAILEALCPEGSGA